MPERGPATWTGIRTAEAALERAGVHGPAIEASRRTIRATIAGMEGRASEAGAGFREAARQWRDLGLQFDLALCHLDLLATIGSGASGARAAADEARLILMELQAEPFLKLLETLEQRPGVIAVERTGSMEPVNPA